MPTVTPHHRAVVRPYHPASHKDAGPPPGHVRLRMDCISICGTDGRHLRGDKVFDSSDTPSCPIGHEGVGWVESPGLERQWSVGSLVVPLPHVVCGHCPQCLDGATQRCEAMKHLGLGSAGIFAEVVDVPASCLRLLPEGFPVTAGPLVEPLACVLHGLAALSSFGSKLETARVGVFGSGPMGCLHALGLIRLFPWAEITVIDPNVVRRSVVQALGFADFVTGDAPQSPFDVTIVAASSLRANQDAISATRDGGTCLLFAGINVSDLTGGSAEFAQWLEGIHRQERRERYSADGSAVTLVGSSGYQQRSVSESIRELQSDPTHYCRVQNVRIDGLNSRVARFVAPTPEVVEFDQPAVEVFCSPDGLADPQFGKFLARALKVLIRVPVEVFA